MINPRNDVYQVFFKRSLSVIRFVCVWCVRVHVFEYVDTSRTSTGLSLKPCAKIIFIFYANRLSNVKNRLSRPSPGPVRYYCSAKTRSFRRNNIAAR